MSAVEIRGLTKRFRTRTAVDDLTFDVARGAVTGFLGPNGAGKSTTLRMLLGLTRPTAGRATVLGAAYPELDAPARRVGAVLETDSLHPGRRGRDHLRIVARAAGLPPARVDEVLAVVGLTADAGRRVRTYSLGMRQRLGLATALLGDPEVLILDEPTNGLDPVGVRWLRDFLRARAATGRTVLLSSHLLSEVALTADHVVIISQGRLVAQDEVAALTGSEEVRVHSPHADRLLELLHLEGIDARALADGAVLATGTAPRSVGDVAARHGVVVEELRSTRRSLEDVYLELTAASAAGGSR
ncbi:MAG: Efflux ABC transporter, ATP-binding protein [uncultured Pseudonocardia sp.]|uniref:Efflux ABC transporter, ATP-binding protein n=1 Tax=uncultured Pseudonocardia sp. TaxID=211455 RepID=A0A6J4PNB2_9PSEU|nr:MAG: Efflux ABC transporter, ATP-binding protein [uncultured Pseudonocardia sp.]